MEGNFGVTKGTGSLDKDRDKAVRDFCCGLAIFFNFGKGSNRKFVGFSVLGPICFIVFLEVAIKGS